MERTITVGSKTTKEMNFYISSADLSAQRLMEIARDYWKIESLHWSLDAVLSEDACRFSSDNAHVCLNALRKYALGLHRRYVAAHGKKSSVKGHLMDYLFNESLLLDVISCA